MNLVSIKIKLQGTWCHQWPKLKISINNNIYFDNHIQDTNEISLMIPLESVNTIILQHYEKKFGENGQWDTVSEDGKIIQDKAIKLLSFELNDVNITKYVIDHCPLVTDDNNAVHTDYYGFNGQVCVQFNSPVYSWIIDTIVKNNSRKLLDLSQPIETSYDNLFDYHQDQLELLEIEKILQQHAHLFNKSSKI